MLGSQPMGRQVSTHTKDVRQPDDVPSYASMLLVHCHFNKIMTNLENGELTFIDCSVCQTLCYMPV